MSNTHVALEAASSLHKNTPVNILSADGSADNQMTIRAPGFSVLSAAATVVHADELKIQCPSSALLQSPIHVEVAEPVYLQFFSLSHSDEWIRR